MRVDFAPVRTRLAAAKAHPDFLRWVERMRVFYRFAISPRVTRWVGIGVQVVAIAVVVWLIGSNWGALREMQWQLDLPKLAAMAVANTLLLVIWALGWRTTLSGVGPTHLRRELRVHAYSNLVRRIPFMASAWQWVGKTVYYGERGFARRWVVGATVLDIAAQAGSVFVAGWLALHFNPDFQQAHPTLSLLIRVGGVLSAAVLVVAALAPRAAVARVTGLDAAAAGHLRARGLAATAIYFASWPLAGLSAWLFFSGTTEQFAMPYNAALMCIAAAGVVGYASSLVPVPLRGVTEVSYALLITSYFGTTVAGVIALAFLLAAALIEVVACSVIIALTGSPRSASPASA